MVKDWLDGNGYEKRRACGDLWNKLEIDLMLDGYIWWKI